MIVKNIKKTSLSRDSLICPKKKSLIRCQLLPQLSPADFIHFVVSQFYMKLFYGFICTCALLYGSAEFWLVPHAGSDTTGRSLCLTTSNWQGDLQQDLWMKPMERDNRSVPQELPPEQPKRISHSLSTAQTTDNTRNELISRHSWQLTSILTSHHSI